MMIKDLGRPDGMLSIAGITVNVLPFVMTTFVAPKHKGVASKEPERTPLEKDTYSGKLWFSSSLFISVLVGAIIPLSVIVASPLEFIERGRFADPTMYVYTSIATAAGLFLVWGGVVFYLGTAKFKRVYSIVCVICAVTFFMNYMIFDENFGVLFEDLRFSELFMYSSYEMFLNVLVTIYVALILVIVVRKYPKALITAAAILSVSAAVIAVYQTVQTSVRVRESDNYALSTYVPDDFEPVLKLSRTGKNVVILVMVKAIGRYIPYILQEKPELTDITDDSDGELIMMQNYMAHEPNFLDPPDYLLTSVTEYNSTEGRDMTVDGVTMKLDNDSRLKNYDTDTLTDSLTI